MWQPRGVTRPVRHEDDLLGWTTLVALAGYGLITFVWRSFLQWRRTGDAGFRLAGELPLQARVSSVLMTAGCLTGPVAAMRTARHRRATRSEVAFLRQAGVALIVLATMITYLSQLNLGRSWRIGVDERERTDLVSSGMFGLVRNPIFSGMAAAAIGTAFAVPSPLASLGAAALIAGMEIQVRTVEEPYLLRTHGQAYRAYASRTGRFFPALGRISAM